ncbi:MAG: HDIG domain-containing protein [Prevotellaceae bacterium]|jgi:putative nucleotidyltransferase with HDIG domain|nr:HDIG domain-containing protein [Prevotellaceae bacterium]
MRRKKLSRHEYRNAVILFLIAVTVIMIFVPESGSFKYKFTQGQQWQYEDLYAPFDFPLYRTDAELTEEREKTAQHSPLCFILDTLTVVRQMNGLREKLDAQAFEHLLHPVETVYRRGVIDNAKLPELAATRSIAIVKGNTYEEIPVSELFTPTSAYEYLQNCALEQRLQLNSPDFARLLVPNLLFDEALSSKIRQKNLDMILPTEGLIGEGTKLVGNNEVITPETAKMLNSLEKEYRKNMLQGNRALVFFGRLILILMCMACIFTLLVVFRSTMLGETKCIVFIVMLLMTFIILAMQICRMHPSALYAVPFTIVPIYISSFFHSRPSIYIHFFMILMIGSFVPADFEFVAMNALAGVTAVVGFKKIYERGQLFFTGFLIFSVYLAAYASLKLFHEGDFSGFDRFTVVLLLINSLLVIVLYQFTFLFERLFGFVSISRLVELADTNRRLFRELTETAPGTAQHVIQVANIAEAVIRDLGGDPLLVRTGALYHDIGKMKNPLMFIENQVSKHSPHENMSAADSARTIIEHVTYGVELAHKHHLPNAVIDFIRTHHGKSKVHYFYMKHKEEHPDDEHPDAKFTYPGPNPSSKEMVALMMADSCEAASRSLPRHDEASLNTLVDKIIDRQHLEGLYNESDLTLRDITRAKQVIKTKLKNIYHARIEYPDETNHNDADTYHNA